MGDLFADFVVLQHERVIFVKVHGSIDLLSMSDCIQKVETLLPNMDGPWASFVDLSNWQLHTPEIIELLGDFEKRMIEKGMSVEISVVGDSEFKKYARQQLFQQTEVHVEQVYVDTVDSGWNWLINKGFCEARPDGKN